MSKTETKKCQNCKKEFTIEPEDFDFYNKIKVPAPTRCPECRLVRRFAWRNERSLYKRNCDLCNTPIISVFSKETGLKVYCSSCWFSDKWDGLEYGFNVDFNRPFLIQFQELLQKVPVLNLFGLYLVNSEYTNMVGNLKNCYLITHGDFNENCLYGGFITNTKDSVDNLMLDRCELCYENVNCRKCYKTFFSLDCENCHNVYFSKNCIGCSDCFGCVNLRNKQYYIFNKSYTKEEYKKRIKDYSLEFSFKIEDIKKRLFEYWNQFPQKYMHGRHNSNVTGDYIYNSKNTLDSYITVDTEDSRFCAFVSPGGTMDCYDFTHYGLNSNLLYDSLQIGDQTSRIFFSWCVWSGAHEVEYSILNIGCRNTFGTIGLKKKEYCILNKQYTKSDYENLVVRIKKYMDEIPYVDTKGRVYKYGEFFPIEMSPFVYNETTAQEYFPLTKEQAIEQGYSWKEPEDRDIKIDIKAEDLPDHIKDVKDDIVGKVIECAHQGKCNEQCTTAFKIIELELQFYKRMNLPLPRLCPNCRHYQRLKQRNPLKLWYRKCQCAGGKSSNGVYKNTIEHFHGDQPCPNEFETTYSPDRPEIVYCEKCYLAEVV